MNLGNLAKRIFITICFTLMVVLAAGAAFAFAENGYGSYSFTIIKQLTEGSSDEAKGKDYIFSIQVEGEDTPREVTLKGGESKEVGLDGVGAVSVTEVTDSITLTDGSKLTAPTIQSTSPVEGRITTVSNNVEGGTITVKRNAAMRAEDTEDPNLIGTIVEPFPMKTWFKITQLDSSGDPKEGGHTETAEIEEGNSHSFTGLPRGLYQIEELKAEEGFYVTAKDKIHVGKGKTQKVVIHGSSAKITIHPLGTKGDGHIHYFEIRKVDERGNELESRKVEVESGFPYEVTHVSEGTYEISEWEHSGNESFTVTRSVITPGAEKILSVPEELIGKDAGVSSFLEGSCAYIGVSVGKTVGLPDKTTYKSQLVGKWLDLDPTKTYRRTWTYKTDYAGKTTDQKINVATSSGKVVYLFPGRFAWNISSETAGLSRANIYVTPFFEDESAKTYPKSETEYSFLVERPGWIEVSEPADPEDHSTYSFVLTGPDGSSQTINLVAGESKRIEGLALGAYKIKETIGVDSSDEFDLTVEDSELITKNSSSYELFGTIAGKANISVTKLGDTSQDSGRLYQIKIGKWNEEKYDWDTFALMTLEAGQTLSAPEELAPGDYNAIALDEFDAGFEVTYAGSSLQVGRTGGTVTFTNAYKKESGAYRIVHEYYLEKDGEYSYEGCSSIKTVNGLNLGEEIKSSIIDPKYVFKEETYSLMNSSYGKVEEVALGHEDSSFDNAGLISKNTSEGSHVETDSDAGSDSNKVGLMYSPVSEMTNAKATQNGEEIIIMRYVRTEKPKANASYHVFHAYYRRTPQGDVFEGGSPHSSVYVGELNDDSHGYQYTSDGVLDRKGNKLENITDKDGNVLSNGVARVTKPTNFTVEGSNGYHYTYTYDNTAYGYEDANGSGEFFTEGTGHQNKDGQDTYIHLDDAMKCAYATEEGNQIIVLRYYRYPSGFYNVVHEYYVREKVQSFEGEDEELSAEDPVIPISVFSLATQGTDDQSRILDQVLSAQSTPEQREAIQDAIDQFAGTLTPADEYEYYFEGNTDPEKAIGPLDEEVTNDSVEHRLQHEENEYTFLNAGYGQLSNGSYIASPEKASVVPTPEGDNLIILRYYRNGESIPDDEPEQSDNPSNPTTPADDGKQDPGDSLSKLGDYLPMGVAVAAVLAMLVAFVAYRMKKRHA